MNSVSSEPNTEIKTRKILTVKNSVLSILLFTFGACIKYFSIDYLGGNKEEWFISYISLTGLGAIPGILMWTICLGTLLMSLKLTKDNIKKIFMINDEIKPSYNLLIASMVFIFGFFVSVLIMKSYGQVVGFIPVVVLSSALMWITGRPVIWSYFNEPELKEK